MTPSRMFYVVSSRKLMISSALLLLTIIAGVSALRDVRVNIPQAAKVHETITLQCHYDLEGDPLYTVKWYKGRREFFRYIPKELPSTQIFPFLGMEIDIGKSNPYNVVLRNVQQNMTGTYSCEVSSDAPDFFTMLAQGYMYVIDPPTGEPEVTIEKSTYEIGDTLRGNCTSPLSYPAINLTWYFNGKKVNESFRTHIIDVKSVSDKRKPVVTVVGLELEIDGGTFHAAKAVLRCSANLFNLYKSQMEIVLEEERPRPRPSSVLGTRDAVSAFTRKLTVRYRCFKNNARYRIQEGRTNQNVRLCYRVFS